jgi:hypothetical protein
MGTAPIDSTRGTSWAAGGKTHATEEVARGVIGATRGAEVEARVVDIVHDAEGEARVVMATCGTRVEVRAVRGGRTDSLYNVSGQAATGSHGALSGTGGQTASLCNEGGQTSWG